MRQNFLKLNYSNTDIVLFGTPASVNKCNTVKLKVDDSLVSPSVQVWNLSVIFDAQLSFNTHLKNITKLAFYHLWNITRIRPFLSMPDAERLIHTFITSKIDYCNSVFAGLPANLIKRLQHIHTSAACVLIYMSSHEHMTPVFF